ncbi:MAG: hypothetical protein ACRC2R_27385 [Xenococcaceae cyanobacterium]
MSKDCLRNAETIERTVYQSSFILVPKSALTQIDMTDRHNIEPLQNNNKSALTQT